MKEDIIDTMKFAEKLYLIFIQASAKLHPPPVPFDMLSQADQKAWEVLASSLLCPIFNAQFVASTRS